MTDAESCARLSENELIATCILLLNAGHEGTVNGFGNGMLALFNHPEQLALLIERKSAELIRSTVEEMLRYDTPLQLFKRWVRQEQVYGGERFEPGQQIALFFGSANRDPEKFDQPETFNITRKDNAHITFGAGIHFCLGAPLARLELETALETVVRFAPGLELAETPSWRESFVIRGLRSLRVKNPKKG